MLGAVKLNSLVFTRPKFLALYKQSFISKSNHSLMLPYVL
nr:MAG TPA: hypothetical protein [Crassvirales sp.]